MTAVDPTVDATEVVLRDVNAQTGAGWRLASRLTGGLLGGAWLVVDGTARAVLKWHDPASSVPRNPDAAAVVAYIRAGGYPTPAWLAHGATPVGISYSIQEHVRGEPVIRTDLAFAGRVIDLVRLQRTLAPPTALSWTEAMRAHVFSDHPAHALLRSAGDDAGRVLADALALAAPFESAEIPDDEMVHGDLSVQNLLVDEGRLVGVVDIDAAGRGCAVYDALGAALNGVLWDTDPEPVSRIHDFVCDTYEPGTIAVAAGALAIESLVWRVERYPDAVAQGAALARGWLEDVHRRTSS